MEVQQEVFFHVGTGKTGTTFLQDRVFPKMKNITYMHRSKYKNFEKHLPKINDPVVLISREFDQQMEYEVKRFSKLYPDATPIIVFRRHDSYIASQYRRFVKNGFSGDFNAFFDLDKDKGRFKKSDLDYMGMIKLLENQFSKAPIVYFYEDLREDRDAYILKFASDMGATIDLDEVNLNTKHASYNEKQLKFMRNFSKKVNMRKRRVFKNGLLHLLWKIFFGAFRYTVLYYAKFFAKEREEVLIVKEDLVKVKEAYTHDWESVKAYVK
jgi:hypothetical protein